MSSGIVISFATEKGGSKKTTQNQIVAEIFANEGYSVNVLDFDPQGTMAKWIERRNDLIDENKENEGIDIPKIHLTTEFDTDNFYERIAESSESYEVTIIDTPGTDAEALREAYISADIIIIPVTPVQNELETLPSIKKLLKRTKGRHNEEAIVRTMFVDVPTHANDTSVTKAKVFLDDIGFLTDAPLLSAYTKHRKIYSEAQEMGLTGFSVGHEKANLECNHLKSELFSMIEGD